MSDFLLYRNTRDKSLEDGETPSADTVRYGEYVLSHYGRGFRRAGDTGIYIGGYLLPRNDLFQQYGTMDQHDLVARLYSSYGKSFTGYVKGCFVVIILQQERVEIFSDHLGLFRFFYSSSGGRFVMASKVTLLAGAGVSAEADRVSLAMQALFNRVPGHFTVYSDIFKNGPADYFRLEGGNMLHEPYFFPKDLITYVGEDEDVDPEEFAALFHTNVINLNKYFNPESTLITLTGGKDSRTILAALLGSGIKPSGFTYGNPLSRDAVYAGKTARKAGISHSIYCPTVTREWFEAGARTIIAGGNPEINIHRSHRSYAFARAAATAGRETAFYAGYMGGELLMGIYYDDLIFTDFLKDIWNGLPVEQLIEDRLKTYFIRYDHQLKGSILDRIAGMACADLSLTRKMREFHGLFEIGIPHHSQDINLSLSYWNYPFPAYLDIEFLMLLFRSRQSFLFRDASTVNPMKRHGLFSMNMMMQHILCPELDGIPFGKRGSYSNREYLRGPLPWSIIKGIRYLTERSEYPPSFIYGREYGEFLAGELGEPSATGAHRADYSGDDSEAGVHRTVSPGDEAAGSAHRADYSGDDSEAGVHRTVSPGDEAAGRTHLAGSPGDEPASGPHRSGSAGDESAVGTPAGDFYDVEEAVRSLKKLNFPLTEKHLHKYSDIVTFNMMFGKR